MTFRITPHKISLCALLHLYVSHDDNARKEEEWIAEHLRPVQTTRSEAQAVALFLLEEIEACTERTFSQLVKRIRQKLPLWTAEALIQSLYRGITAIAAGSPDDLLSFLGETQNLLTRPVMDTGSTVRPDFLFARSALGLYARRFILESRKMMFSRVSRLFDETRRYVTAISAIDVVDRRDHRSSWKESLKSTGTDEMATSVPPSKLSRTQIQAYLETKIEKLERVVGRGENHPGVTQAEISALLELQPNLPQAYLYRYLNCVASRNVTGAIDASYRYFDFAVRFGSRSGSAVAASAAADGRFRLQYASLNLAILHFRFGHVSESLTAIQEAVRVAQQHGDRSCIARALFWLYHIASAAQEPHAVSLLRRCRSQAAALGLHSLERLATLNLAAVVALRPSYRSASDRDGVADVDDENVTRRSPFVAAAVWDAIRSDTSTSATDLSLSDRSVAATKIEQPSSASNELSGGGGSDVHALSRSMLLRSAIWEAYGNSCLSREALAEQLQLSGRCDADATCLALCKLAMANDRPRSHGERIVGIDDFSILSVGVKCSMHARSLRIALKARRLFPHAPSVPSLAWPRTLCLALFRRSLMRGELRVAEMASLQLSALSLPSSTTVGRILSRTSKLGGKVRANIRAMLPSQQSSAESNATAFMFIESCVCAVELTIAKGRYEDALATIATLRAACDALNLPVLGATLQCEAGRTLLKSVSTQPATAIGPLFESFTRCRALSLRLAAANCAVVLAELHLRLDRVDQAATLMRDHLPIVLQHGDARACGRALMRMAELRIVQERHEAAADYLARALRQFVRAEDSENAMLALYTQSRLLHHTGDTAKRNEAARRWNAVAEYRKRAANVGTESYQFLNRTEKLAQDLRENPNPLYLVVYEG